MMTSRKCLTQLSLLLLLAFAGSGAEAQMKPGVPCGWRLRGSRAEKFECGVDSDTMRDGKPSAYLRGLSPTIAGDAVVVQVLSPHKFMDQRVQLSGWVRTKDVQDLAGLWMRIGGNNNELIGLDNMENRPVKGTTDWSKCSIVLDVPTDSKEITIGFSLHGPGTCWVNGLELNPVAKTVATTNQALRKQLPEDPVNMDFTATK